ncbi:hypothetical protein SRHO_G00279180 [Serrasalmus rhombeus]
MGYNERPMKGILGFLPNRARSQGPRATLAKKAWLLSLEPQQILFVSETKSFSSTTKITK